MLNVKPLLPDLIRICEPLGVKELDLFGSAVRSDFGDDSDVDALVHFQGRQDLFNRYMSLLEALQRLFQRKVDLVMVDGIRNPVFKAAVMAEKVPIYAA